MTTKSCYDSIIANKNENENDYHYHFYSKLNKAIAGNQLTESLEILEPLGISDDCALLIISILGRATV